MPTFEALPISRGSSVSRYAQLRGGKIIDAEIHNAIIAESIISEPAISGGSADDLDITGSTIATTTITEEAWTAISLQNSWADYGGAWQGARYRKDSNGVVHIQGLIDSGTTTATTLLFTLPVGYRPAATICLIGSANTALARYDIASDGTAKIVYGFSATYTNITASFAV